MLSFNPSSLALPQPQPKGTRTLLSELCLLIGGGEYLGLGRYASDPQDPHWLLQSGERLRPPEVERWAYLPHPALASSQTNGVQLLDDDGYPTQAALLLLKTWNWNDPRGWLALAKELWSYPDRFNLVEEAGRVEYLLSTGGWSGNESVIRAMQENFLLWSSCWVSSARGGKHVLQVRDQD